MINHLVKQGIKIRKTHDAIKLEPIDIDLIINENGDFIAFSKIDRIFRPAEAILAKKGKARLLLDKPEEVLAYHGNELETLLNKQFKGVPLENIPSQELDKLVNTAKEKALFKHRLFIQKLKEFEDLPLIKPVLKFYFENRRNGYEKALAEFEIQVDKKNREGNIAFRIRDERIHENQQVLEAIISKKEMSYQIHKESKICSICGSSRYPITEQPHGMIKRVPAGQTSGCALVSFNENAFESYGLTRNENSSICSNCARNYVEALNYLLNEGYEITVADSKGKQKKLFKYKHRKNFGEDTAMVFWTREDAEFNDLDLLDKPDPGKVAELIDSIATGKHHLPEILQTNQFYSLTLSGAASRIIIRNWIEISLEECRRNIAQWFKDIEIISGKDIIYPSVYQLASSVQRRDAHDEILLSRAANLLWNAALKNDPTPLWILSIVLRRIAHNQTDKEGKSVNTFTSSRASLIKLTINRINRVKGGIIMKSQIDFENISPSYVCGRIFAVMEGIQQAALGKDINAGIRDRFFSAASSSPAPTFGRLMRLTQSHLSKIRQDKPGLAVMLDRELQELCSMINEFPAILTLEEQGQFALGYYHQKQFNIKRAIENKELELTINNQMED